MSLLSHGSDNTIVLVLVVSFRLVSFGSHQAKLGWTETELRVRQSDNIIMSVPNSILSGQRLRLAICHARSSVVSSQADAPF
jgi:hypothetical protein